MRKVIKCLTVVYTCILIVIVSCCPAFATSDYIFTHEDFLDMGYEYQGNGFYTRAPGNDFVPLLTYPTYNTAPTYSFFNPSIHIPWDEMPKHILEIVRTDLSDFSEINNKASSDLKIPFVFVAYNGQDVWIYLGYNLALGYAYNTGVVRIFGNGPTTAMETDVAIGPSICYRARYSYNSTKKPAKATLINEFEQRSMSNFSGTNKLVYYSSDILTSEALQPDYYFYGANAISLAKNSTTKKFYLPDSAVVSVDNKAVYFCQDINGFDSGHFLDYSGHIPGKYFASFDIPSAEDIQNNKLDSIKDAMSQQNDILTQTQGYTEPDKSVADDMNELEEEILASNYNPDNFSNDFKVNLDGKAINAVFAVMDSFLQIDSSVFGAVLTVLTLGVIALIFGR